MGLYCSAVDANQVWCIVVSHALQEWCQATAMWARKGHWRGLPKYTSHCVTNPLHVTTSTWPPWLGRAGLEPGNRS